MKYTMAVLALAASALAQPMQQRHAALHRRAHARDVEKRNVLATTSVTTGGSDNSISWLASANTGNVFLGYDAGKPYNNEISNDGEEAINVLFWATGQQGSVNKGPYTLASVPQTPPLLMFELQPGEKQNVSYTAGFSGAYTAVHSTSTLGMGNQLEEAWVEFTASDDPNSSTVDVTRESLASGGYITSVKALDCTSDFDQCFFGCTSLDAGPNACWQDYSLMNCDKTANPNANTDPSGKNGGCFVRGNGGTATFFTSFGKGVGQS